MLVPTQTTRESPQPLAPICTLPLESSGSIPTFIRLFPTGPQHAYIYLRTDSFDMVLGIRASYHPAQSASHDSYQSPLVCPCAACFDKEEHRQTREACDHPAKEISIPSAGGSVPKPPPDWKRKESAGWQKFGLPLGRRRTAESTASTRPLRTAAQEIPPVKE